MGNYVLSLRAPKGRVPTVEEEARWPQWLNKIGGQIVDMGALKRDGDGYFVSQVGSNGAERPDVLAGYIVITADSLDAAVAVAEGCPMLLQGGTVEVGEMSPVTGPKG